MVCGEDNAKKDNLEISTSDQALHGTYVKYEGESHEAMAINHMTVKWVLDSGASHHMTPLLGLLKGVRKVKKPLHIMTHAGSSVLVETMGDTNIDANIALNDVLFIPDFSCNLISMHKLTQDLNCTVTYDKNGCVMQDQATKRTIGLGDMLDGVYVFKGETQGSSFTTRRGTTVLWHSKLGHPSSQALQQVTHFLGKSFDLNKVECCDICHRSKQCRVPFNLSSNKAERPSDLIHCDVWGKYHTASHNGSHYFLTIVDDFT